MKKILTTVMLITLLSGAVFGGPLLGIQLEPKPGSNVGVVTGWEWSGFTVEAAKSDLGTWIGDYSLAALWTPQTASFGYRAGIQIVLYWDWTGFFEYEGLDLVLGVSHRWDALQAYADLVITPAGYFAPRVGVDLLFANLVPGE
jgi:hypothetical protein